jgi:hypothetical protein
MKKGLSLLDFVYLNQKTDFASTELKSLIKTHGSLHSTSLVMNQSGRRNKEWCDTYK